MSSTIKRLQQELAFAQEELNVLLDQSKYYDLDGKVDAQKNYVLGLQEDLIYENLQFMSKCLKSHKPVCVVAEAGEFSVFTVVDLLQIMFEYNMFCVYISDGKIHLCEG